MALSWLKKLGQLVLKATDIAEGWGPVAAGVIPGTLDDKIIMKAVDSLHDVSKIIIDAEVFGAALNLTGADKLTAATPAVAQLILQSSIMAGHPPKDQALFMEGAGDIASGMAKVLNSRGA